MGLGEFSLFFFNSALDIEILLDHYTSTYNIRKRTLSPVVLNSEGYTFSATALYRGVYLFLGSIDYCRLARLDTTFAPTARESSH